MRLLGRAREPLHDRAVWQCASLLLAYPAEKHQHTVGELLHCLKSPAAERLSLTADALRSRSSMQAAAEYVDTFDLRRRCTMYLTYWTAGDTRQRGREMLAFATAYRDAGVQPPDGESPDFLPVVLEFAAIVDPIAGRRLLTDHRVPIDVLSRALHDRGSPYRHAVAAVLSTLSAATDSQARHALRLAQAGPPKEAVGLQPFTLTVPPRRMEGG